MTKPVASAPMISLKVRRLETSDVADYRDLRLESLKDHPEAFASSWEHEADKPVSWWVEHLETNTVCGGWLSFTSATVMRERRAASVLRTPRGYREGMVAWRAIQIRS
jgi:hypothetical protein